MVLAVELAETENFSPAPRVELVNIFSNTYDNAIATARTCYSSRGIITPEEVSQKPGQRERIAQSIYQAGHHTTLQHAYLQFAIRNVSRQFLWSFLHSHPFYNSEQVSQRFVHVSKDSMAVPPFHGRALSLYHDTIAAQIEAYNDLCARLVPLLESEYLARFPVRRGHPRAVRDVEKKAQEVARYVLPVATLAYLYHTISVLTLMRYYRLCRQYDAPVETRSVVNQMISALLQREPLYENLLEGPLDLEETPEGRFFSTGPGWPGQDDRAAFRTEFDAGLEGHTSRLVGYKSNNESLLADAVREVVGLPRSRLSDDEAIATALDPARNRLFGEALNLTTLSKLTRTLHHAGYTFRKKLSHTADSQDQRHRMTPASRPALLAHFSDVPDYIVPAPIRQDPAIEKVYRITMGRTWEAIRKLRQGGERPEFVAYLLPNAVSVRFTESADLLNLRHKLSMRLCYNAQEEIWRASRDEAKQIQQVNPRIGQHLGAPCHHRCRAHATPFCPEGDRYCGVRVWKLDIAAMQRVI